MGAAGNLGVLMVLPMGVLVRAGALSKPVFNLSSLTAYGSARATTSGARTLRPRMALRALRRRLRRRRRCAPPAAPLVVAHFEGHRQTLCQVLRHRRYRDYRRWTCRGQVAGCPRRFEVGCWRGWRCPSTFCPRCGRPFCLLEDIWALIFARLALPSANLSALWALHYAPNRRQKRLQQLK
jgi:hypothetical protein